MKRIITVATMFLFSCGGGGGGITPPASSVSLYFTDNMGVYPSILAKVYEVNLCSDQQCQQKVNLFSNQQGLEVDLAKLNGILQYITTTSIPQGTYNRLEVVMDKNLTVTDSSNQTHPAVFSPMQERTNKPNTVQCDAQKCYIRFNGTVNPFATGKLIVDFVLKDFVVNTSVNPWQITEVSVQPTNPNSAPLPSPYYWKLYVNVQNVNTQTNSFSGVWFGKNYQINLSSLYKCEINKVYYPPQTCINYIQSGMCIEVKGQADPATSSNITALEVETENSYKCMASQSAVQPPVQPPPVASPSPSYYVKMYLSVRSVNPPNGFVGTYMGQAYSINTSYAYKCEIYKIYYPPQTCTNYIQPGMCLEVKGQMNSSNITAFEVETENKSYKCVP